MGGRVARFGSQADRQKAYRNRLKELRGRQREGREARARVLEMPVPPGAEVSVPVEAPAVVKEAVAGVVGELVEFEGLMLPVKRVPRVSEGDYVALSIRGAQAIGGRERLERAVKYAKWRYAGYRAGKVASLW